MSFQSFEEIIRFAIDKEKEAVTFYQEISSHESYSGSKKVFQDFAEEEKKHQAFLEGFLGGEKKLPDYDLKWIPDIKRSDYMVDITYEKGMPYTDALRLAMKREEKALALYNDLRKQTDNEELIKVFQMLAQEEAKHKLALEQLYDDYMAKQGD
ncbi:MAG: ferritin family protein [Desulfatiglans sp.]|jgi:rubrerythrin|nr:ferritin family protein [Thermodesulfobacteriota bacterium]MEE4354538.1 ferritin family protein [Desulfatiglans sp.]